MMESYSPTLILTQQALMMELSSKALEFKVFFDRVSLCLCSSASPGTHSVDQVVLELAEIHLLCLQSGGTEGMHHPCPKIPYCKQNV